MAVNKFVYWSLAISSAAADVRKSTIEQAGSRRWQAAGINGDEVGGGGGPSTYGIAVSSAADHTALSTVFASHPLLVRAGTEHYVRAIQQANADDSLTFYCAIDEGIVLTLAEWPGLGVEAKIGGERARLGRPDWVGGRAAGDTLATAFRLGDGPVRPLHFHDGLRPDARDTLARLDLLGLPAAMISGDRAEAVAAVAGQLGIKAHSDLQPGDKLRLIETMQAAGHHVLMVGDGLNDGPALKAAYVSVAPSSASDVGKTAADVVFMGDRLMPVALGWAAFVAARHVESFNCNGPRRGAAAQ